MFVDLTPEQHALRLKVRDYFSNLMTPELRSCCAAKGGDEFRGTIRQMGKDGWLPWAGPRSTVVRATVRPSS